MGAKQVSCLPRDATSCVPPIHVWDVGSTEGSGVVLVGAICSTVGVGVVVVGVAIVTPE